LDDPAVRRPGWRFVLPTVREHANPAARWCHHANAKLAAAHAGERNEIPARRPFGSGVAAAAKADPLLVRPVDVHGIELLAARAVAFEHDFLAIGREAAADVDPGRSGQPYRRPSLGRDAVDVRV